MNGGAVRGCGFETHSQGCVIVLLGFNLVQFIGSECRTVCVLDTSYE